MLDEAQMVCLDAPVDVAEPVEVVGCGLLVSNRARRSLRIDVHQGSKTIGTESIDVLPSNESPERPANENGLVEALLIEEGLDVFNFGRCTPGGGTHRFKRQWGGEDVQLHWIRWASKPQAAPPSRDASAYRWATAVWQRLPLPVANFLGPRISRGLPAW